MTASVLSARGLTKRYGTITAVDGFDIDIDEGEIVALVGDNGAGKSTLIKMLSGAVVPDAGTIAVSGGTVRFRSPLDARSVGIETIYQDLALLPNLDVATNLYLGREETLQHPLGTVGFLARGRMRRDAQRHLEQLKIRLPRTWGTPVSALSGGQRQSVAIARAMVWASRLVIMDEPTAALGVAQSQAVLELVRNVRDRGTSVVIISHILPHVLELADRVVVMRHGAKVADVVAADVSQSQLIELIVGVGGA